MTVQSLRPLILLYTDERSEVDGATRFQKLMFLAREETDLPEKYAFHADRFGPYSYGLADDLDYFVDRGWIQRSVRTNEIGNEKHVFTITTDGQRRVRFLLDKLDSTTVFDSIQRVKQTYGDHRLDDLLRYVYRTFPEYTTETDLDLDRLFDPEADSEFTTPDDPSEQFAGGHPGSFKSKNPTADELFDV